MLLSSPLSQTTQAPHDEASGFGFDIKQTGLLQVSACHTTVVNSRTTAASAARHVLYLPPRDHIHSALKKLQWLPLYYRSQFKLALLMSKAYAGQSCICQRCRDADESELLSYRMRSVDTTDYIVPWTRTTFG